MAFTEQCSLFKLLKFFNLLFDEIYQDLQLLYLELDSLLSVDVIY